MTAVSEPVRAPSPPPPHPHRRGHHELDAETIYRRRWWTLAALCSSMLIIVMDNTILNVAIPTLVDELHASNSQLAWIVDSYTIVFAGLLLTCGSLGDRFGRKRALTAGLVLFAIGSSAAALQTTANGLIGARAFMGIGGALIMPSTLSILTNVFRNPRERAKAISLWAAFSGIGIALGPITGGILLRHFSWSSVFWVNIPIVVIALVAGRFLIPESRNPAESSLDPLGAGLSILGLVTLLFGIIEAPVGGWSSPSVVGSFSAAFLLLSAFIAWELYTPEPMLDMRFYRNRRFSAANAAVTLTFFANFGSLFLMTQFWQFVRGYSPLAVGFHLIPYALTMMFVAPFSAVLVERFGTKRVMVAGLIIIATSLLCLSMIDASSGYIRVIVNMMATAMGIGLTMPPATESIMGSLPRDRAGVGSAVNDTTRQIGGALGVAVIGSVVASVYGTEIARAGQVAGLTKAQLHLAHAGLGEALQIASTLGSSGTAFAHAARVAFVDGMSDGLRIGASIVALAGVLTWKFLPGWAADADYVEPVAEPAIAIEGAGPAAGPSPSPGATPGGAVGPAVAG